MELFQAIFERRSVRKYKTDDVSDSLIDELLDAARWAPSGGNAQPWRFVVVKEKVAKKMLKAVSPGLQGDSAVIIVACFDFGVKPYEDEAVKILDIGAAIQNLLLAAHALGLGACWVYSTHWKSVKEIVGIPKRSTIKPISLISIGYPIEKLKPRDRLSIEEITFRERFGVPWITNE